MKTEIKDLFGFDFKAANNRLIWKEAGTDTYPPENEFLFHAPLQAAFVIGEFLYVVTDGVVWVDFRVRDSPRLLRNMALIQTVDYTDLSHAKKKGML